MANKFLSEFRKLDGYVAERVDPFRTENLIKSRSPGVNWVFGNNHGFPKGYSMLLWGEKKAGKSLLAYDFAGSVMQADPDAVVIKFDTEMRDMGQLSESAAKSYGIDLDRWVPIASNKPEKVFDQITGKILVQLQKGAKVPLMIIDSISGLMGRREAEQDSVTQHQIGDHAVTLQIGLKAILEIQRQYGIALILTAHSRAEMDQLEIRRGNKTKPAAANAVFHHCEYILNVERDRTKDGNKDLLGNELVDESRADMKGDAEGTGHKIRVWMQGNTMGVANRESSFTFDYSKGIVNQHEEIFLMGKNWGIIERDGNVMYKIGSESFRGQAACLEAIATRPDLQQVIMQGMLDREKTLGKIPLGIPEGKKAISADMLDD